MPVLYMQIKKGRHWDWHWLVEQEEQINKSNTSNPDLNQQRPVGQD